MYLGNFNVLQQLYYIMNMTSLISYLLYLTIFIMLLPPSIDFEFNTVEFGPLTLYLFEIPLILTFCCSFFVLAVSGTTKTSKLYKVYIPIALIAIIGLAGGNYDTVPIQSILKDLRFPIYWLAGLTIVFAGDNKVSLKHIFWVVFYGLIGQFIFSIILVYYNPDILFLGGYRLPFRSGWLILLYTSLAFMIISFKALLLNNNYYPKRITSFSVLFLLLVVIFTQSRTIWIVLSIFILYGALILFKKGGVFKIIFSTILFIIIFTSLLQTLPYNTQLKYNLSERIFNRLLSTDAPSDIWHANREVIYKNEFDSFFTHPIFGNGFGNYVFYNFSAYKNKLEDRSGTLSDNSFMNVLLKTGVVGLFLFVFAIFNLLKITKNKLSNLADIENWIYLKAFVFAFPFIILASLNIAILYGYPEVIIFSIIFAKANLL